jgi:WD40 repeat protein
MSAPKLLLGFFFILLGVLFACKPANTLAGSSAGLPVAAPHKTLDTAPRLVLETGSHLAVVRGLIFSADGRQLVSVSDDKTIRIWSVSPDGKQARLARIIRGQIEDGRGGQLAAATLSPPDGSGRQQWLAVGGYLAGPPEDRDSIRLHDFATGEVSALLRGHTDNVLALAFSPSGRWLASAGKDHSVRLWDLSALQGQHLGRPPLVLTGHTDRITGIAWTAKGDRLASASFDGTVGLWDTSQLAQEKVALIARLQGHAEAVRAVAFHPHGTVLASGGQDRTIRLWQASDGKAQGAFAAAEHQVSALAFSPDGQLVVAGNFTPPKPKHLTIFGYPSGKPHLLFSGHDNLVVAAAFHPSGRWLATGGGDHKEILLWDASNGKILSRLEGKGQTVNAVGFSKDGRFISWGHASNFSSINDRGPLEQRFDLKSLDRLAGGIASAESVRARERLGKLALSVERGGPSNIEYRLHVERGGQRLSTIERGAADGTWHSAYTFTPDGQGLLSGGQNGELRLFSLDGRSRAKLIGHTGEIKALAVSDDGRWALSGSNDQTIILWNLGEIPSSGAGEVLPTLTLFPTSDKEWIAWTQDGYFTASARGARYIGYSVNQGLANTAQYVSVDQLYDRFYRPDLVYTKLHGDPQKLWKQKEAATDVKTVIAGGLAPRVAFIDPAENTSVDRMAIDARADVMDQGGGIGKIVWKINDTTVATDTYTEPPATRLATAGQKPSKPEAMTLRKQLALLPGENTVELIAYNQKNEIASAPAVLKLIFKPALAPAPAPPPEPAIATPSVAAPPTVVAKAEPPSPPSASSTVKPAPPPAPTPEPAVAAPSVAAPPPVIAKVEPPPAPSAPAPPAASAPPTPPPSAVKEDTTMAPTLHLLVVGIDHYRDKALKLKYAVHDGKTLVDTIRLTSGPLFRDIKVTQLFDDQVTFKGLELAFNQVKAAITPQDVFIFYLAGHGVTLGGRYYFLPQDFRYYNEEAVRANAVNQDHLQNWLAGIPARKSLVLVDTCESGSFSQSLVAMRGMAEKTAVAKLTRATGRATIVASTDEQPAAEGYQGHGVFTYVLLEGLRHADHEFGNRDGYIGLFELAAYVNDRVPAITMNAFNYEQIPQIHMVGTDFPIGVVKTTGS